MSEFNKICITQVASTVLSLLGAGTVTTSAGATTANAERGTVQADSAHTSQMAPPIHEVLSKAHEKFDKLGKLDKLSAESSCAEKQNGQICDRVVMYNPDAIALWIYNKYYKKYFSRLEANADLMLPMLSVFPPVTPVCFGSMYTGLQPAAHGIQSYTKPVLKCETVFDRIIAAGKKAAIVSTAGDSISLIFLEREMDYFIYKSVKECNEKAAELIKSDKYDLIVLYNTDYDYWMHRSSPTGFPAKNALRKNVAEYIALKTLIQTEWGGKHRTALAFAPDHGCHRLYGLLGTHGINAPCDMNTVHLWSFL